MIKQFQKNVLILALYAGEIMMKSGAEIYRVEDTIVRICKACKIPYVECFATTTGIFLSLDGGDEDGDMFTFIKRIQYTHIDLAKISKINEFSRVFTTTDLSVTDGLKELRLIDKMKPYHPLLNVLGAMLIGAFLCPGFGGSPFDMAVAAAVSGCIYILSNLVDKLQFIDFVVVLISCALCSFLSLSLYSAGLPIGVSPVIIASITIFLPGVSITNAARDILSGDMLSGTARFVDAVVTAIGIAGGIGLVMKLWIVINGSINFTASYYYPTALMFLFAVLGTLGFCILFNVPRKHLILVSLIGGIGLSVKQLVLVLDYDRLVACFLGACVVAILAEFGSRAGKDATTLFILPGIVPLVPGSILYAAMRSLLDSDLSKAAEYGAQTLLYAGAIALALVLAASVTRIFVAIINKIRKYVSKK